MIEIRIHLEITKQFPFFLKQRERLDFVAMKEFSLY